MWYSKIVYWILVMFASAAEAREYRAKFINQMILVSNGQTHYLLDPGLLAAKLEKDDEVPVKIYGTEIWITVSKSSASVRQVEKTKPFFVLAPIDLERQKRGKDYRTLAFSTANHAIYYPPKFCISCATSTKLSGPLLDEVSGLFKSERTIASYKSNERSFESKGESTYENK